MAASPAARLLQTSTPMRRMGDDRRGGKVAERATSGVVEMTEETALTLERKEGIPRP